jgi:hypothetical protein
MPPTHKPRLLFLVLASMALCWAVPGWACSVPVFRYALEKWTADSFHAVVFHRGLLSEEQQGLVKQLGPDGLAGHRHANVSAKTVDLDQSPAPEMLELWERLGAKTTPWLVVKYPTATRVPVTFSSAPLSHEAIAQLLESPARTEITERLADGENAVWVLLESGDAAADKAAAERLEQRLDYLTTTLTLPKLDEQDIVNGLVSVPEESLRVGFSVLRVARSDPAERVLVEMLLGTEPDLAEVKEPIAFPVFGRGRALYALVGNGIASQTIDRAATFLIGKCSCQVKEENPGVDLLFAANWEALLKVDPAGARELPKLSELIETKPVTVTISAPEAAVAQGAASEKRETRHTAETLRVPSPAIIALAVAGFVGGGLLLLRRR